MENYAKSFQNLRPGARRNSGSSSVTPSWASKRQTVKPVEGPHHLPSALLETWKSTNYEKQHRNATLSDGRTHHLSNTHKNSSLDTDQSVHRTTNKQDSLSRDSFCHCRCFSSAWTWQRNMKMSVQVQLIIYIICYMDVYFVIHKMCKSCCFLFQ